MFHFNIETRKQCTVINLRGSPKMCVFAALNFAVNPQNTVTLKYSNINSKEILLLFKCSVNNTFRHRIETLEMLVAMNLIWVGVFASNLQSWYANQYEMVRAFELFNLRGSIGKFNMGKFSLQVIFNQGEFISGCSFY